MLRVGIYGGAFAPIHVGHVEAAKAFMSQMWLDVLFVIPTGCSPHKEMDKGATDNDRLEMCRLAFEGVEGVIVSDMEIRRGGQSYSIDTLRELSDKDRRLFMLCGTDMMLNLGEWDKIDEIFSLSYPAYIRRENDRALDAEIIAKNKDYFEKYGKYVIKLEAPVIEVSSSMVREKLRRGEDISGFIDPKVLNYINEQGLYK
jgi:nicotinate-nucleotide adenylyltransferase